ncbi:hypothetical protein C475_19203 [Halosimplex carlsbadense 2-9-1]|uniref:C2H2-type domain-containing protein n=1 Tax=Halosimplex carlsbadense 2-9-1 TaxID=797114 RepID=M0CFH7_9EURY|nr:hypothetical protein [Halosimplex carlsbadense]ELZ21117.1 hypothetical protein C475_19203 [Halosimplex carlsbadense 2-9-1]
MPECNYCDESFESESAYLDHLEGQHLGELGPIDRRRVGVDEGDDEETRATGPILLGGILVVTVAIVGFVLFSPSGGGGDVTPGQEPTDLGAVHYHGTMEMVVNGQQVDFGRQRYQMQSNAFHFEGGRGTRWHVHARGVTLQYALGTLGFNATESSVTYQGTTYRDGSANTTVRITVNGEPVTPRSYGLRSGDQVRVVVERS